MQKRSALFLKYPLFQLVLTVIHTAQRPEKFIELLKRTHENQPLIIVLFFKVTKLLSLELQ